jgi:hypothetical protein
MRNTLKKKYFLDTEFVDDGRTIDLISIGIVAEDGREYYAQSIWVDLKKASPWVLENVVPHLIEDDNVWKNRKTIKQDILIFMDIEKYGKPELWGYYSAYDHVVFCQLFGTMMDLPEGYPRYTRDLKQWCDQLGNPRLPSPESGRHHALDDARWNRDIWQILNELETEKRKKDE